MGTGKQDHLFKLAVYLILIMLILIATGTASAGTFNTDPD